MSDALLFAAGSCAMVPALAYLWRGWSKCRYALCIVQSNALAMALERTACEQQLTTLLAAHNYATARIIDLRDHIAAIEPLADLGRKTRAHRDKQNAARKVARAGEVNRIEQIGAATLYLGDALEILPTLAPADLICSDPPYRVSKGGFAANLQLEGGFGGWMKDYGNQGDIVECDLEFSDWMAITYAALQSRAHAYFMCNGRNVKEMQWAAEEAGFRLHTLLVWDKRTALPNKYYQNVTEFGLFMFKGKARTINDPASKNLVTIFQRDVSPHPTEKPVELMRLWVGNSSSPGQTVLDPFMGSGTTGVAALQLHRSFIGIEKDERWFDIACKRVADAQRQGQLFGAAA